MDTHLGLLAVIEKPHVPAAFAEDSSQERRCLPTARGCEVNIGGKGGFSSTAWVAVELRLDIEAHCQQPLLGAQHRSRIRGDVDAAGDAVYFYQLGQNNDATIEQFDACHKTESFGRLQQVCCLIQQGHGDNVDSSHQSLADVSQSGFQRHFARLFE